MKKISYFVIGFILLFVLNFVAHTFQYQNMGLYEDDYGHIASAFKFDSAAMWDYTEGAFTKHWPQGRPIGFTLPRFMGFVANGEHTLQFLYLFGALILTVNALLVFRIIRLWFCNETVALIGAILFSLFPADTTKSLLVHIYQIQISLLFCLIGIFIFFRYPKLRFITYILGFLSLITYESPFTLLILLPLFLPERKQKKVWITHLAKIIGIILLTYFIRISFGEGRVLSMDGGLLLIAKIMASVVMGPVISMGLFLYGPARTVLHMNRELFIVMVISFPIFAASLLYLNKVRKQEIEPKNANIIKELKFNRVSVQIPKWIWQWLISIAIVFIWLMSAYLLSFTHFPPVARYGRATSVHAAATFPASLLATLIIWGIWKMLAKHNVYRIGYVLILALYFSVTLGNRYSIQQDFVQSWTFQKQYWNEIIDLVPDAKDGTIIFVVDHNLPKEHYIESTTWTDYFILGELIEFPSDWNRQPMVLTTDGNWENDLQIKDETISFPWNIFWDFTIDPDNIILITDTNEGKLVRVDNSAIQTLSGIYIEPMINQEIIPLEEQYKTRNLFKVMEVEEK